MNRPLEEAVADYADAGVPGIVWREPVGAYGVERAARLVRATGLTVTSTPPGRLPHRPRLPDGEPAGRRGGPILDCPVLVLASGGLPAGSRDLDGARQRVPRGWSSSPWHPCAAAARVTLPWCTGNR
ncbi:hypothetical protein [Micromonospora inyonensis]|nr:hypothetical protein [Micromonospora inyonensis]